MRRFAILVAFLCGCLSRAESEHEITRPGDLLHQGGTLREPGWARRQLLRYNREQVADPARLREWDFFTVMNSDVAVNVTIANLGLVSLATVSAVDFASGSALAAGRLVGTDDLLQLSASASGETRFVPAGAAAPAAEIASLEGGARRIRLDLPASFLGSAARGELTIFEDAGDEYLSLATPFPGDARGFFFEQKIPGLRAQGTLEIGGVSYAFDARTTYAVMDWGRGIWPSDVLWRWGGGFQERDGRRIAFNLGNGFGDMSAASENVFVVDGVAHKLGPVDWEYDPAQPREPWRFRDRQGRLDLTLDPIAGERGGFDLGAYYERPNKVYGTYRGTVVLEGGRRLELTHVLGFAEEMQIRW